MLFIAPRGVETEERAKELPTSLPRTQPRSPFLVSQNCHYTSLEGGLSRTVLYYRHLTPCLGGATM